MFSDLLRKDQELEGRLHTILITDHQCSPLRGDFVASLVHPHPNPHLQCVRACVLSCISHVRLCVTLWTVAVGVPRSTGFSRQEHWSRLLCPPPGALPDPGIKAVSHYASCISRWVLDHECHLGSPHPQQSFAIQCGPPAVLKIPVRDD